MERKRKDEGVVDILSYFSLPPASQVLLSWGSAPFSAVFAVLLRLRKLKQGDILPAPQWLEPYDQAWPPGHTSLNFESAGMTQDLLASLELFRATERR